MDETTVHPGRAAVERLIGDSPAPLIEGRSRPGSEWFDVLAPATGDRLAQVSEATADAASAAVAAASGALPGWASMPAWERFEVLRRGVEALRDVVDDLAELISAETGKPLTEARGEAANTVRFFEWFSHETLRLPGEYWPEATRDRDAAVLREPVGVVAAITPWNFPAFMVACKVGAALAAGCTVVLKPAEQTPLTALAIAGVFHRAGLPAGVWNVVPAGRPERVGEVLLTAAEVACVSFTGSRAVGELMMRTAAGSVKRVLLELGGNSAAVVLADADLELSAAQLVRARFLNAGQACMAANRVYAVESVYDELVARLGEHTRALRVGDPRNGETNLGPLIDLAAVDRLEGQLAAAVAQGAEVLTGGRRLRENTASAFLEPALVAASGDAQPAVFDEELFGPALAVVRCRDEDEAVRLANATEYGLAGYVFTRDHRRAIAVSRRLVVGSVAVNCALISEPQLPFGGAKASGIGRERGRAGVEEFLEFKTVQIGAG
ncbi:aldehyde dehydrogenase family protein [Saccharopolyspora phatthalungensis]|uniref:Succinate-semialdehyde dehydrogenase/glutarate-semialdehyde dehydrogenase n=1 Tax=Saccharopolyspora phatthalungensis TaxID=664693 RepID=A0A840QKT8_9PSEU|nr:aldehyde dehydrogenase family protein [Saccharopolyspora phatthalungensis]MBB5159393.1 succinate-semialdehyde dehydrogenase/glutarate-semialdehyde dehydrogenase [Saccharopolyspora phatthalungensis]